MAALERALASAGTVRVETGDDFGDIHELSAQGHAERNFAHE
jgi:hypothetical protein